VTEPWIAELQPVATDLLEENAAFQMAADRFKAAKSPAEMKDALDGLKGVKGKLAERAKELTAKAASQLAEQEKRRAKMLAEGKIADGTYKLLNRKNGKAIDVEGRSKDSGHKVHLWAYTGATNQQWNLTAVGGGYYTIVGVDSAKALEVPDASTEEGMALRQWDLNKSPAQRWKIEKTDGPWFKLTAECSGRVLAGAGDLAANGAGLVQTTYTGTEEQQWKIELP
jgi:Ricin-type beta-trefoil lectin domain-like